MTAFIKKYHVSTPLGNHLRETRLNRGISIKKASADLNIAGKYLEALENQEPRLVPSKEYFNKWIKVYASYLGVTESEFAKLQSEVSEKKSPENLKKHNLFSVSEWFSRGVVLLLIGGLVIFFAYRVNAIFSPPPLKIISPQDGTISHARQMTVAGVTAKEVELVINNKIVFVDQNGQFTTSIDLRDGLNVIKVTAQKRYSRPQEASIRVLFGE